MKKVTKLLLISLMSLGLCMQALIPIHADTLSLPSTADEIATIKHRLKEYFLEQDTIDDGAKVEAVYVSQADTYLTSMSNDGSWSDVDYTTTTNAANGKPWSPYLALDRMQALAIAFNKEGNALYHDTRVITALNQALMHWDTIKPSSTNWWENDIGVNLRFSRIGLFLENELSTEALNVITSSLNEEGIYHGTGQNNLWYDQNAIYRALITNDGDQLKKVLEECLAYILVLQTDNTTLEALQVDNSLYFHGIQFYSNGYGLSMFRDMSFWLYMLRDTSFAMSDEVVNRMSDYMLDGTRWTIRKDIAELYLGYRPYKYDVEYKNYAEEYIEPLQRMMAVDLNRAEEYQVLLENVLGIRNDNGLNGNNYMWRVGYASQMRENYGVNVKMDSNRIVGGEWRGSWPANQDRGNLIYWTSSASSTYMVDGDEYVSVFPTFDWAHSPGVTAPNYIPKDYSNYGRFKNNTDHTIGVSNGVYGSTSYAMDKKDTKAKKSYFFFDDEIVAVGSGINSTNNEPIHTTINQSKAKNVIVDGQAVASGTKGQSMNASWIHNDAIGYVFPNQTNVVVSNGQQKEMPSLWPDKFKEETPDTFKAWIDHGTKPQNESYSYIVLPSQNSEATALYANAIPIEIVENSSKVHAVTHHGLKQTQLNFFEAGSLTYAPDKTITVDRPVNIILDEKGDTPIITVAMSDTSYNETVNVVLTSGKESRTTEFVLDQAPYTGKSMTLVAGTSNKYTASTSIENHGPALAFDQDLDTYWHSDATEEQWIQTNLGKNKFVSSVTINWTDDAARTFKLRGSNDGHTYFDLTDVISNDEKTSTISVNANAAYIRIEMMTSANSNGYGIKEVDINAGDNIALNQAVKVSSTSAKDSANVAAKAVDGDGSSRWSSARDSNADWFMIDLGGEATIQAVNIAWEAARSSAYTLEISDDQKTWTPLKLITEPTSLVDNIILDNSATGRYIRINSTQSVSPKYGISIFEFEVYGSVTPIVEPERENLAYNKPSQASSEYMNPKSGFVLESKYAFDDSTESKGDAFQSRWVSKRESHNEWIQVDLEADYLIDLVTLNWEGAYGKAYRIQVSSDQKTWTDIQVVTDGRAGIIEHKLSQPVQGRYVRMQGDEAATKYGYSLWEFEVYGELAPRENIALNKETTASSEYVNPKTGLVHVSKLAVDGSTESQGGDAFQSRWVSNREAHDEWLQIDFAAIYAIDKVILNWENAHASKYRIQASMNGNTWTDVQLVTEGKAGISTFEFEEPFEARYLRIYGDEAATKYGFSLWEVEAYGINIDENLVDTSELEALIHTSILLESSNYTTQSFQTFQKHLIAAQQLLEDDVLHQDTVNEMVGLLSSAIDALEVRDDEALRMLVAHAQTLNPLDYTVESYQELQKVLDEVFILINNGASTNEVYVMAVQQLENAIAQLKDSEVKQNAKSIAEQIKSLTILDGKIILPQYDGFTITIDSTSNVDVIDSKGTVTQGTVDEIVQITIQVTSLSDPNDRALTDVIEVPVPGLPSVNTTQLQRLLLYAKTKKGKNFTKQSYAILQQTIAKVEMYLSGSNYEQIQVNHLLEELSDAMIQLENQDEVIVTNPEVETPQTDEFIDYGESLNQANTAVENSDVDNLATSESEIEQRESKETLQHDNKDKTINDKHQVETETNPEPKSKLEILPIVAGFGVLIIIGYAVYRFKNLKK